jgi:hypothetical protein
MTDISKLADDLIALINSKPRSPTRDEVLSVLMAWYIPQTEEAIEASLAQIRNAKQDAWNKLSPSEKAARPCFAYASERHHYEVDPHSTRVALPDEVPNRCNCGAIDTTDPRTVRERAAAIEARYEANRKELAEPPLEPKGAPIHRDADITWPPAEDYTAVIKRDGDTTVATVYTVNKPPQTYRVSQAALDNALSCENGHDWEGDSHVCHRCGARAVLGNRPAVEKLMADVMNGPVGSGTELIKEGAKGNVPALDQQKCADYMAARQRMAPHVESEEF